jgi:hypothetical protein
MNTGEYKRGALNISFLKSILMAGVLVLLGSSVAFAQVGLFPDTGEIVQWPPLVGSGAVYEMHFGDGEREGRVLDRNYGRAHRQGQVGHEGFNGSR